MALVNRNLKFKKEADEIPLMDDKTMVVDDDVNFSSGSQNNDYDSDDEMMQEKPLKQHNITLWLSDAIVLVIEHLQYYAILLSLSERWGWPIDWVNATSFTFIFNFDIWEFRKVETGLFDHSRTSFITSSAMGFHYVSYLSAWAVILCIIAGLFGAIYFRWMKRRPLYLLMYIARWKRVMFLVLQFLCIPFGVAAARIFHCRKDDANNEVMDVQNEYRCFDATHIAFMTLVSSVFLLMFFIYPFITSKWIKVQVFSNDAGRHEGYLQLKEAEYEQGLDILWDIGQYHLFSSYRKFWIYYNPLKFLFKFLAIVCFAFSVHSPFWSSACMTILFVLATFTLIFKRPYRVRCFNVMIICSHFIISANALIGNFMVRPPWEDPDSFQIVSFLRYPAILRILVAINVTWLCILFLWIVYMVMLNNGLINKERIWPRLSYDTSNTIGEDTKKYLKAALKARHTLEHSVSAIPLFAPIHELSHQIKVINAYCREAEYIGDPTHDTLWDLLDELIEAHNALVPISVFGMSGKNSIRETSEEFIKLMPSFKRRLKQREYDYILMSPIKRRLLLKMYVLSIFINSKRKHLLSGQVGASKLQEALMTFEGKAIEDFDFYSTPPSTAASASSRPLSTQTGEQSRSDSDMTGFLRNVDAFTSLHPKQDSMSKISLSSANSSSRPSSKNRKEEKPTSRKSSSSSVTLSKPARNQVSPTPLNDTNDNRPNTAPLSPKNQVHHRRNSTPLSPIPQGISLNTFKTKVAPQGTLQTWTELPVTVNSDHTFAAFEGAIQTPSNESFIYPSRPSSAPQSSLEQASFVSSRPNTAPYPGRQRSPFKNEFMFATTTSSPHSSHTSTPTKEMSSTASLPGQIDEELNEEVRRSSTLLH